MITEISGLLDQVRGRFAHVHTCPFDGPRVFFEHAGGALTLNSVVETTAKFASHPDNQGRENPATKSLMAVIDNGRSDSPPLSNFPALRHFVGKCVHEVLVLLLRTPAL